MTNQIDKLSSRSSREKRALEERIKMAELMAELKYSEKAITGVRNSKNLDPVCDVLEICDCEDL